VSVPKVRVHEISKQLGVSNAAVIEVLSKEFGVETKSHSSTVDQNVADKVIERFKASGVTHTAPVSHNPTRTALAEPVLIKRAPRPQAVPQPPRPTPTQETESSLGTQGVATPASLAKTADKPASSTNQSANAASTKASVGGQPSNSSPAPRVLGPTGPMARAGNQPYIPPPRNQQQQRPQQGGPRPGEGQQAPPPPRRAPMGNSSAPIRIVPEREPGSPRPPQPQQRPMPGMSGSQQQVGMNRPMTPAGRPAIGQVQRPGPGQYPQQQRPYPQQQQQGGPGGGRDFAGAPQRPVYGSGNDGPISRTVTPDGGIPKAGPLPNSGARRPPAAHNKSSRPSGGGNKGGSRNRRGGGGHSSAAQERLEEAAIAESAEPKVVQIDEAIIVRDLAILLGMRDTEIIKHLFMKGMMVTVNQTLDMDFARTLARELEFIVEVTETVKHEGEYGHLSANEDKKLDEKKFLNLTGRSPVVSIMGHVDHGKTTLLDAIRETRHKIVDGEAGGITQSIGAYTVQRGEQRIVFLDTPGHEAFTSMRMRGAQATDIAILVVAADDGVMPQTIEAINHAKVAKIPIIVAVNKIDKADADPDKVLVQLAEYGLSSEKWGGDTLTVEVSALQKLGLDDVLDAVILVSELLELQADATVPGEGVIIEAQLDKRMGPVATALVRNGNLKVGDNVLIGSVGGRVRALIDDHGQRVNEAGPSTPVSILGLDGVPKAGDAFKVMENDKVFKQDLAAEKQRVRDERIGFTRSVAGFSGRLETEENKENQFNLLVKADTQGSLEAVLEVLQRMTNEEVKINIVHSATGDISEADVMLASTANALIIGFNTKADSAPQRIAEQSGVNIKKYDVIYHITEDIEKWVLGQLSPETEEQHTGTAEIRQIFTVGKTAVIAGCMVTFGKLVRNAKANVMRDGKEIYSGPLNNLKRFKDDVKEVATGYECGISFDKFQDLQMGDQVEVFTTKSTERTSF
jgi:translation initiation factor IF-2